MTRRHVRARRSQAGLTTLEWLLITAAIAAIAALGTAVVHSTVAATGESVAGHSARLQAANLASSQAHHQARASAPTSPRDAQWLNSLYGRRCRQIPLLYADSGATTTWKPGTFHPGTPGDPADPPRWKALPSCAIQHIP